MVDNTAFALQGRANKQHSAACLQALDQGLLVIEQMQGVGREVVVGHCPAENVEGIQGATGRQPAFWP